MWVCPRVGGTEEMLMGLSVLERWSRAVRGVARQWLSDFR